MSSASRPSGSGNGSGLDQGVRELCEFIRDAGGTRIALPSVEGETVTVPIRARDDQLYYLEITAEHYLERPPRCHFVDASGERTELAWPAYDSRGPFRPPHFICTPPTAEFYQYHSERTYRPGEGTLACAVGTIFAALQAPQYQGRHVPGSRRRRRARRQPL